MNRSPSEFTSHPPSPRAAPLEGACLQIDPRAPGDRPLGVEDGRREPLVMDRDVRERLEGPVQGLHLEKSDLVRGKRGAGERVTSEWALRDPPVRAAGPWHAQALEESEFLGGEPHEAFDRILVREEG